MAGRRRRVVWMLRHAKAVADTPVGGTDHDRQLAPRGRRDAKALGRRLGGRKADWLSLDRENLPQLILCSTATRTRETIERVLDAMKDPPPVEYLRSLYLADPDDVFELLRQTDDAVRSVMLVGHNPTAQAVAAALTEPAVPPAESPEVQGFATCAVAVASFPAGPWSGLTPGTAAWARVFAPPY